MFTRRQFLELGGLLVASGSVTSCQIAGRELAQAELPERLSIPEALVSDPRPYDPLEGRALIRRLLNRAGYGPRPGDLARASEMGFEAYLEEQLEPDAIEDSAAELMVRGLSYYSEDSSVLMAQDIGDLAQDLAAATIGRAIYSRRQLYEAMVEFWSDHFNIYLRKNRYMTAFKIVDDREVIRPHAMGNFRDLLLASAQSPAMLVYLDNARNLKGAPNENYARELMELHTLGVDGGYNQEDVRALAQALTGWGVQLRGPGQGRFRFNPRQHDGDEKRIMDYLVPAGAGQEGILALLEMLAEHPATAHFIAGKLVHRFATESPAEALVGQVAGVFQKTGGDIKSMLRTIFNSQEFASAPPKLKRPYTFLVSAVRSLNGDVSSGRALVGWLEKLGQVPFLWPAPNGYPNDSAAWASNLLPRWNFSLAFLSNRVRGLSVNPGRILAAGHVSTASEALDLLSGLILGQPLDDEYRSLLIDYASQDREIQAAGPHLREAAALLIASPDFQWA